METHLNGTLARYGPGEAHTALLHPPSEPGATPPRRWVVFVGGLSDGLLWAPYVVPLARRLAAEGWGTAHPLISSSLSGWGTGSLERDASELRLLALHLEQAHASRGAVILGHSTGCQDAVESAKRWGGGGAEGAAARGAAADENAGGGVGSEGRDDPMLLAVILQAPVSDRECLLTDDAARATLAAGRASLAEGDGGRVVGTLFGSTPVSASRAVSLLDRGGADDYFSSDFSEVELEGLLGHLTPTPSLFLLGESDECYPEGLDVGELGQRLVRAAGERAALRLLPGGHSQMGQESAVIDAVIDFLGTL